VLTGGGTHTNNIFLKNVSGAAITIPAQASAQTLIRVGGPNYSSRYSIVFQNPLIVEDCYALPGDTLALPNQLQLRQVDPGDPTQPGVAPADVKFVLTVGCTESLENNNVTGATPFDRLSRIQTPPTLMFYPRVSTIPRPAYITNESTGQGLFQLITDSVNEQAETTILALDFVQHVPDGDYKVRGNVVYKDYASGNVDQTDAALILARNKRRSIDGIRHVKDNRFLLEGVSYIDAGRHIVGGRSTKQIQISDDVGGYTNRCAAFYTAEPYLEAEVVTGDLRPNYQLDSYREEVYTERFDAGTVFTPGNADTFPTVTFNDIRVLEMPDQMIVYCVPERSSRGFELNTMLGDCLLGMDLKRVQWNERNCLLENTPESFLYDEFSKVCDKYSYRQWRDSKQMFVFNHESLGIKARPGQPQMSNLTISVTPKLSKYWRHLKRSSGFPTGRDDQAADVQVRNNSLLFKCCLVMVYKNRAIQIREDGQVSEVMRQTSYSQPKITEPKATVQIASGGALDALRIQ
jgi:hypothetical protein